MVGSKERPAVTRLKIGADHVGVAFARPTGGTQAIDLGFVLKVDAPLTARAADRRRHGPARRSRRARSTRRRLLTPKRRRKGDVAAQSPLSSRATKRADASYPNPTAITERLSRPRRYSPRCTAHRRARQLPPC
jgi:hypothetical protein